MIPIIIIEDDEETKNYLSALITGSGNFKLNGSFGNAEDSMRYFESDLSNEIRLVLTDIQLPGKSGIDFISWLKPLRPDIQFMVLSVYSDTEKVFKALKAGATAYILKSTNAQKIIEALIDLSNGGSPMSNEIARKVVNSFPKDFYFLDEKEKLSIRENEVLAWLSKGFSYKEIGLELFISVETVRSHIHHIYEKLHACNKQQALKKVGLN